MADSDQRGPGAPGIQSQALYRRVLNGDAGAAQVWFDARVLDRYRQEVGTRVMRTNSVGRVRAAAGWSLDFGIGAGERVLHTSLGDLQQRLPAPERPHWIQHLATLPVSEAFLSMRLAPGSCIDDGDTRDWPS